MIDAIINYNYMQNALFAAILSSLICGIMGTIIVEKKLVSMSGGIAHASFGGIGAGYFFGIEPIIGGLVFAVATSLSVVRIKRKTNANVDTVISMFWSAGMAIGILFIGLTKGYPPDITSYLFGDILMVNDLYIRVMLMLTIIVTLVIFLIFNYWKIYLFDEEYAKIIGIRVIVLEVILYALISISIVILIKVVGIILSIAMLTIPTAISKLFLQEMRRIMIWSSVIGCTIGVVGLTVSYYIEIPSGATIILVGIISYYISMSVKRLVRN